MKVDGQLSATFTIERGILQGSVLSPVLFLLVIDPLLRELEESKLGPSISGIYAGAYTHVDDIRTITSSLSSLNQQVRMVQKFAKQNALVLNPAKCEVLITSSTKPASQSPLCTLSDQPLFPQDCVKCLGYWWSWDLSATKGVDEAIKKARRAFIFLWSFGSLSWKTEPNFR